MPSKRLLPHKRHHEVPPAPQWPSYAGVSTFVGTSPSGKVNVWYDATVGPGAQANAQGLVAGADAVVDFDSATFGTPDGIVNVIVFAMGGATDGTGGADHMACDFLTGQNIEVCVSLGRDDRVLALFEAELSECQMRGDLCGMSTGEALSRWCSMLAPGSNNALSDFASAPVWQQAGYPNWVDQTASTDQDYNSIGCGMAFLSWLMAGKNDRVYTLAQIAQAMVSLGGGGTLAQLEERLGGTAGSPWRAFLTDVQALGNLTSDDPFNAMGGNPTPVPTPIPPTPVPPNPVPVPTPTPVPVPAPTNYAVTLTGSVQTPLGAFPVNLSGTSVPSESDTMHVRGFMGLSPNWPSLISDVMRLVQDYASNAPVDTILADVAKIAQDVKG